jgi:hypothetical protein
MTKTRNLNCLYNVYLPEGVVRMTDREATKAYGPQIWDWFGEAIDHSEWCDQPHDRITTWVDGSPVNAITDPPF